MMTDNELDNLFKNTLGNHEAPVPADMWQRIQPGGSEKRPVVFWWRNWYMAAAVLLVAGVATWWYAGTQTSGSNDSLTHNTISQKEKNGQKTRDNSIQDNSGTALQPGNSLDNSTSNQAEQANTTPGNEATNATDPTLASSHKTNKNGSNHDKNDLPVIASENHNEFSSNSNKDLTNNSNSDRITKEPVDDNQNVTTEQQTLASASPAEHENKPVTANNDVSAQSAATNNTAATVKAKKESKKTKHPWSAEFLVSAAFADKQTYDVEKEQTIGMAAPIPPPQPKPSLRNYSASVRVGIPLTKNLTLKTGLQLTQTRQKAGYQKQNVVDMISINRDGDTSYYRQIVYETENNNSTYNAVSIPVLLSYQTGKKIQVGITAGAVVNAYSWYTGKVPNADYTETWDAKNTYKHNTGTALYAGISASKKIGAVEVFAEPHVQYSISSITKKTVPFKQKINTYGLSIGVRTPLHK